MCAIKQHIFALPTSSAAMIPVRSFAILRQPLDTGLNLGQISSCILSLAMTDLAIAAGAVCAGPDDKLIRYPQVDRQQVLFE